MALADTAALVSSLELKDKFTSTADKFEKRLAGMERSSDRLGKTLGKVGGHIGQGLGKAVQNIERIAVVAGGLAVGGAAAAVKWAGDFEAQLNTINTVAQVTPQVLEGIGQGIRDISKKTGLALEDLTSGYYDLVSAGIKAKDAQAILNDAVTLGVGGLATTAEAVDLLTTAINAYGLDVKGAAAATDAFAQAVADGKVKASEIAATFADIAPLAKANGISINEIAAAFGFLTAKGVAASEVTTQMKRALIELLKPNKNLIDLQKKVGENFAKTASQKGLVVALQDLRKAADANHVPLTDLFGRVEGLQFVLQTTGPNARAFAAELDRVAKSSGEAAKQMAERQQGLNFALDRLKANVKDAGITIGSALIPPLAELSTELTKFISDHQGDIKTFGTNLAKAFRDGVTWAKSLDLSGIGEGLKTAAGAAKTLVDAFIAAPDWLKTAVITGWGLNKLTGGAVQNIFGDVLKGIGGQFLSRGSNPGNPIYTKEVGLGGAGGPTGGGIKGLLTGLLATAAIGIAIDKYAELQAQQGFIANQTTDIVNRNQETLKDATAQDLATRLAALTDAYNQVQQTTGGLGPAQGLIFGGQLTALQEQIAAVQREIANRGDTRSEAIHTAGPSADTHSEDRRVQLQSIDAIRANTVALATNARTIEQAWLKRIDPKDIAGRSQAKTGRAPTKEQVAAIRSRDILHQLEVITTKSKQSNEQKLARLQELVKAGDPKTAAKVKTAIAEMKAKIAAEQAKTTGAVTTGTTTLEQAIAASKASLTVNVTTEITANGVTKAITHSNAYGPSSNNKGTTTGGVL